MNRKLLLPCVLLVSLATACSGGETTGSTPAPIETTEPSAAVAAPTTSPEVAPEVEINGAVALGSGAVIHGLPAEGECTAHSEYVDVKEGAQVQVVDGAGAVVAVATLGTGKRYGDTEDCVWEFTVTAASGGGFYGARLEDWESDLVAEADLGTNLVAILPAG